MADTGRRIRFRQPTPGLRLALDPRLPREAQAFELEIDGAAPSDEVLWRIDERTTVSRGAKLLWPVTRGSHRVTAQVVRGGIAIADLAPVDFVVK